MPRAPIWSEVVNSAETLRDRATTPAEWAWLAEGEGSPASSRLEAAVLGRAYDACRAAGVFVESAAALGRWAGVDKSKVIKARAALVQRGLLKPCGIRLDDGRPVRDESGEGRVNNQCGYLVDARAVEAARRRARRARAAAKGRAGGALETPDGTTGGVTASREGVTPSQQGVSEKPASNKDLSGKEKEKEKEAAGARLDALAASWIGGRRGRDRELKAYEALLAMGYHPETVALAADNFTAWIRRFHAGSTRMTLLHFLTAASCRKWLTTASAQRARRAARDARKGRARKAAKARPAAPAAAYTLADLEFVWCGPGQFLGRTPGGYEAMFYPAIGHDAMDGELSAEELRAWWARQYGEQGVWSRPRAGKSRRAA